MLPTPFGGDWRGVFGESATLIDGIRGWPVGSRQPCCELYTRIGGRSDPAPFVYHRNVSSPDNKPGARWDWVREAVRVRGVLGALRYYAAGSFELLRDLDA